MNLSLWIGQIGLPVCEWFTRKSVLQSVGALLNPQVSSAVLSTFNGIQTFAEANGVALHRAEDSHTITICHSMSKSNLRLLLLCDKESCPTGAIHLDNLLRIAETILRMLCQINDFHTESQLCQEVQTVRPIMSYLVNHPWDENSNVMILTKLPEAIFLCGMESVKNEFFKFLRNHDMKYGALFIRGRRAFHSSGWSELTREEQIVLQLLISHAMPKALLRDLPLFVPTISSSCQYRLITIALTPVLELALICGSQIEITPLRMQVVKDFGSSMNTSVCDPVEDFETLNTDIFISPLVSISMARTAPSTTFYTLIQKVVSPELSHFVSSIGALLFLTELCPSLKSEEQRINDDSFCLTCSFPSNMASQKVKDSASTKKDVERKLSEFFIILKCRQQPGSNIFMDTTMIQSQENTLCYCRKKMNDVNNKEDSYLGELFVVFYNRKEQHLPEKNILKILCQQMTSQLLKQYVHSHSS